jgi:hypothetical protein
MCAWISVRSYAYFFDRKNPVIVVQGMHNGGWYSGDIEGNILVDKSGYVSLWVDDIPLMQSMSVAQNKHFSFAIPTEHLQTGEHVCKVACVDKSYYKNCSTTEYNFFVDNRPLQVEFLQQDDFKVLQGRTLHVKFQVNKEIEKARVKALAANYDCFPENGASSVYECFIPIACEEKPQEYHFSVEVIDRTGNKAALDNKFKIVGCNFKKQVISVDATKLQEEREKGRALAELEEQLALLAQKSPQEKLWRGSFCTPIEIDRVTCEYGTIRTTQERGRYAHKALDVINKPKSVVWSTQDGVVALKDRFDFSGNTVVVDHGQGVFSLFYHLDDFANIEVGQKIAKGNPVGTLGKTGYATGYHLHWEMRVNNVQVDPMQWTEDTF